MPIPILLLGQIRLKDRFQHDDRCHLNHPIFDTGDASRPLLAPGFGYPYPAHGLGPIGFLPWFLDRLFQPAVHPSSLNRLESHPVHTRCATVATAAPPRVPENVFAIQLVIETVKPAGRLSLRFGMQRLLELPDTFRSC
jgi:hypothetical protein